MFANLLVSRRIKRKQLDAIIASDPSMISLERKPWIDDGSGGKYKGAPDLLKPQICKIMSMSVAVQLPLRTTVDGKVVQASTIMLMERRADVREGDGFIRDGQQYQVLYIYPDRSIVTRCELLVTG